MRYMKELLILIVLLPGVAAVLIPAYIVHPIKAQSRGALQLSYYLRWKNYHPQRQVYCQ